MNTIQVNDSAYHGAGWAYGLIFQGRVIAAHYIVEATGRAPTVAEAQAALRAFKSTLVVIEADAAAMASYATLEAAQAADADEDEIAKLDADFAAKAVRIRLGMMSGGQLCVDFTKAETAKAGIDPLLHV